MPDTKVEAKPAKKPTITLTLDDVYYDKVTSQAALDDRTPAKWAARYLQNRLEKDFGNGPIQIKQGA